MFLLSSRYLVYGEGVDSCVDSRHVVPALIRHIEYQDALDLLDTNVDIVADRGYLACNSSQCTTNMSANGYSSFPLRDNDSTRQKLSTKTTFPSHSPKQRKKKAATATGMHVPGPLQSSRLGRIFATNQNEKRHAHNVEITEVR